MYAKLAFRNIRRSLRDYMWMTSSRDSTVFFIPLLFPIILTVFLIAGTQLLFGKSFLQEGLVLFYGMVTILLFCAIYLTYFGATMFLFKKVILRPE